MDKNNLTTYYFIVTFKDDLKEVMYKGEPMEVFDNLKNQVGMCGFETTAKTEKEIKEYFKGTPSEIINVEYVRGINNE